MKYKIVWMIILVSVLFSCGRHIAQIKSQKQQFYFCPMHKNDLTNFTKPGKCPKCGMDLISYEDYRNAQINQKYYEPDIHSGNGGNMNHSGHH